MKKQISLLLVVILLLSLSGCCSSILSKQHTVPTDQINLDHAISEIMEHGGYTSCEFIHNPNSELHTDSVKVVFQKTLPYGQQIRTDSCVYIYNSSSDSWTYYNNQGWSEEREFIFNRSTIERTWKGTFENYPGWTYEITVSSFDQASKKLSAHGFIYDNKGQEYGRFNVENRSLTDSGYVLYINHLETSYFPINISIHISEGVTCSHG